jgi:hypothetical protein
LGNGSARAKTKNPTKTIIMIRLGTEIDIDPHEIYFAG